MTLKRLTLARTPSPSVFRRSMARRFLVNQVADQFEVFVNDERIPEDNALAGVEFDFPTDYKDGERPEGLSIRDNIGFEQVGDDEISWRIRFTKAPITTEELRGISVFCGIKVAQTPFFFNLSGEVFRDNMASNTRFRRQVQAHYLDKLPDDVITTERQRINWDLPVCGPLESWGKERVRSLLSIWKARRAEEKLQRIDNKVAAFSERLLKSSTVRRSEQFVMRLRR